tara:strand:- start:213 stop:407 length:195 start_codon:yes stop_codon:yes gene_type:complete|eukprot:scaffold123837_cov51-Phaeocystis_antarctica.AAC.1
MPLASLWTAAGSSPWTCRFRTANAASLAMPGSRDCRVAAPASPPAAAGVVETGGGAAKSVVIDP